MLRILVVDDVQSNRKLVARMARNRNHRVDEAQNGREAVDKVRAARKAHTPYDTILMDYEMPVLKGPEAVQEIREMGCQSLIIGITGNVLADDVSRFVACGANAVLPKPVRFQMLEKMWIEHGVISAPLPPPPVEGDHSTSNNDNVETADTSMAEVCMETTDHSTASA